MFNTQLKNKKYFQNKHSLQIRKDEADRVLKKYPERIPIICQELNDSQNFLESTIITPFFSSIGFQEKKAKKSKILKLPEGHSVNVDPKIKYLVPMDLTIGQFGYVLRKRLFLKPEIAMTLFINNSIYSNSSLLQTIYDTNKDEDGFLYIYFKFENTFG